MRAEHPAPRAERPPLHDITRRATKVAIPSLLFKSNSPVERLAPASAWIAHARGINEGSQWSSESR